MEGKSRRLIINFVVLALVIILIGKVLLGITKVSGALFVAYGIIVTAVVLFTFLMTSFRYKDPYMLASQKKDILYKPFVSILVAAHNEERIIGQCVDSLISQTYKPREIIVVNDASTDNTAQMLDVYAQKGLIKVIHLKENVGKKKALAQAMLKSKGEVFAFTDSDSIVAADAVNKTVKVLGLDPLIGAISGHCRALNADKNILTKIQDSWYEGQFSVRKAFESSYGAVTCISGPLAVFRREAIYNFIPAWENDTFLGQEFKFATDRTLTGFVLGGSSINKIKQKYAQSPFVKNTQYESKDWKAVYCKSAKAYTNVPDTFGAMLKQQIRWKKSFIRNMFFTGSFYWKKPLPAVLLYYLHILFVFAGPLIVFRHLIYLPMHGNILSAILYLAGIIFVGFMFGLAYKMENRDCHKWIYRPLMSLMSTLVLSWLIFYSLLTIKKSIWARVS